MSKKVTERQTTLPVPMARSARLGKAREQLTKGDLNEKSLVQYAGEVIGPPAVGKPWTEPAAIELEYCVEQALGRRTQRLVVRASKRGILILIFLGILTYGAVTRDRGTVRRMINAFAGAVNGGTTSKNGR